MWALAGGAHGVQSPALTLYGQANQATSPFYDVAEGYKTTTGVLPHGGNDWCDGDNAITCATNTSAAKGTANPNGLGKGLLSCMFSASGVAQADTTQCTATTGFDGPSGVGTPNGLGGFAPLTPTPTFNPPTGVKQGVAANFSGSATDPFPGGTISSYSWGWGDGTGANSGATPNHTYAADGTYTVTLTATDGYGQVGTISHTVSVSTPPPPGPAVSSVGPTSGPTDGGNTVVITGAGFTGATKVWFSGNTQATSFTINSDTKITATAPAHAAGVVNVFVTTPAGITPAVTADHYTYGNIPAVTGVSPSSGPTAGGNTVVITGTGFTGATKVWFSGNTQATSFSINSDTKITATAPLHAVGLVNVYVTTTPGTSAAVTADHYTYGTVPAVVGVSPPTGPTAGGDTVVIMGTGFSGATKVLFSGTTQASSFTVNSDTKITATAPPHAAGVVNVYVTTAPGTSAAVTADHYTYTG
jgi:hypothetical protein